MYYYLLLWYFHFFLSHSGAFFIIIITSRRRNNATGNPDMYGGGGSSKIGRGAPNRRSFPPPPAPHRSSAPGRRPSLGASSRNAAKETASTAAVEETFSLTSGSNPLAFSMIIRLAPDLVEEIRRVESQGGTARMKFGPNPHNTGGNVTLYALLVWFSAFDWLLHRIERWSVCLFFFVGC